MTNPVGGDLPDWQRRVASQDDVFLGIFSNTASPAPIIDVSQFNSLIFDGGNVHVNNQVLQLSWLDPAGNHVTSDYLTQIDGAFFPQMIVPVRSQQVQVFYSNSALVASVWVYGSQRLAPQAVSNGFIGPIAQTRLSGALLANTVYTVGTSGPQGWVQIDLIVSNPAVTGEWLIGYNDINGTPTNQRFADTTEFHSIGSNLVYHGQVIMPHVPYTVNFICRTAGTAQLSCNMIPLGR